MLRYYDLNIIHFQPSGMPDRLSDVEQTLVRGLLCRLFLVRNRHKMGLPYYRANVREGRPGKDGRNMEHG